MKVLFVCNQNMHRSKTAEGMFSGQMNARSKGLFRNKVETEDLSWADVVFVMEDWQRSELAKRFPEDYMKTRILNLNIPDVYSYNQPELKKLLSRKMESLV